MALINNSNNSSLPPFFGSLFSSDYLLLISDVGGTGQGEGRGPVHGFPRQKRSQNDKNAKAREPERWRARAREQEMRKRGRVEEEEKVGEEGWQHKSRNTRISGSGFT